MWSVFSWEASRDCAFGHAHSPSERESRSVHRGHAHCSPPGFLSWDSPGENTGLGCHSLLQRVFPTQRPTRREYWTGSPFPSPGVFPTQRLNPGLLHFRQILYQLSHIQNKTKVRQVISMLRSYKRLIFNQPFLFIVDSILQPSSKIIVNGLLNSAIISRKHY